MKHNQNGITIDWDIYNAIFQRPSDTERFRSVNSKNDSQPMNPLKKTSIIMILSAGLLISCRKEKLSSEYDYLYGKWKWIYTYRNYGEPDFMEYNPSVEGADYSLEISKKHIVFYKNGKKELKRYFKKISVHPGNTDTSKITFFITLNKKEGMSIDYFPNKSYAIFDGYPFDYNTTGEIGFIQDEYANSSYFKKE